MKMRRNSMGLLYALASEGGAAASPLASDGRQRGRLPVSVQGFVTSQRIVCILCPVLCLVCCAWKSETMTCTCCVHCIWSRYKVNDKKSRRFGCLMTANGGKSGNVPCSDKKLAVSHMISLCACLWKAFRWEWNTAWKPGERHMKYGLIVVKRYFWSTDWFKVTVDLINMFV